MNAYVWCSGELGQKILSQNALTFSSYIFHTSLILAHKTLAQQPTVSPSSPLTASLYTTIIISLSVPNWQVFNQTKQQTVRYYLADLYEKAIYLKCCKNRLNGSGAFSDLSQLCTNVTRVLKDSPSSLAIRHFHHGFYEMRESRRNWRDDKQFNP